MMDKILILLLLGSALVSGVFCAIVGQQFVSRKKAHQLAWALALLAFSLASFAAAMGLLGGWTAGWFKTYYLFGAIVNVPILALGTIYLLFPRMIGHVLAVIVAAACLYAAGAVFSAELQALPVNGGFPDSGDVLPANIRSLSRLYSLSGAIVLFSGALWSAARFIRSNDQAHRPIAMANIWIAVGTLVVAGASRFARLGLDVLFALFLLIGISIMFAGFLRSREARPSASEAVTQDPSEETG